MKGIRPEGKCPICKGRFIKDREKEYYRCPEHLTKPERFTISIFFKGERIFRGTTLEGKTLRTFADAHDLLSQARREIEAHKFDPTKWKSKVKLQFAFNHLIESWYQDKEDEMKKGTLAPSYVPKLRTYIELYYKPFFVDEDVREIRTLKPFQRQLPGRLSPKYKKNVVDALKNFFNTLKEDFIVDAVPTSKTVEVPEHEPVVLSQETQRAILDLIPTEHRPIFTFLFNQGVRPSEARALKWKDIEGDTVTIRRTWSGETLREQTKTGRIRYNLLFDETLKALPSRRFPEDFVFTHGKGIRRHYSHNYLNKIFNTACRKIGLEIELYEATKHSFGTQRVNEGVPLELLQQWFGHTSAAMTKRYAKLKVVDAFRSIQDREKKVIELNSREMP